MIPQSEEVSLYEESQKPRDARLYEESQSWVNARNAVEEEPDELRHLDGKYRRQARMARLETILTVVLWGGFGLYILFLLAVIAVSMAIGLHDLRQHLPK